MSTQLKDLYTREYINLLSVNITNFYPNFLKNEFIPSVFDLQWHDKELKERMHHISQRLQSYLPQSYIKSIQILKKTFLYMNYDFSLQNMIFQDYVEQFGLDNFEISMDALESFTINSSSEFAIRRFIIKYPKQTMQQMRIWAESNNFHIRRLASEGCRPRLPWAIALKEFKLDPTEVLKIIKVLKDDKHKYVQKSIANNLNDISKDHPDIIKDLASQWIGNTKALDAIVKHGCRTLLKQSDRKTLNIFGFKKTTNLILENFIQDDNVAMGEEFNFSFLIKSLNNLGKLRLEFALFFLRKNKTHSKKVFKISEGTYKENSKIFQKKYSFKNITTRSYYKGLHKLEIIINGEVFLHKEFHLI
ncbi:MAG: 3-methyladenine DNA glycosylase AlkC [Sulfurimonas sp.]|jgi:3-methyladenine DNA glycosylase AlkC|uniref:DNA alkylation repair protein n=1 Tax=Sulfurimonas sp. TaxID=2022749 RepID=UPI0039E4609B